MLKVSIQILLIFFILGSCSVERRLYRPGLSIQWFNKQEGHHQSVVKKEINSSRLEQDLVESDADQEYKEHKDRNSVASVTSIQDNFQTIEAEKVSLTHETKNVLLNPKEDSTIVDSSGDEIYFEEDPVNDRTVKSSRWIYITLFVLLYAIIGLVLWFGALYPFHIGVILIFPLSFLFGLDDRAGFLFAILSGLSYIGLYFLTPMVGFWGIFFMGVLAVLLSLLLATFLDDKLDQGERKDDFPPPPPPQVNPGDDW